MLTTWITSLEPSDNVILTPRMELPPGIIYMQHTVCPSFFWRLIFAICFLRFAGECKAILKSMEDCFEELAKCQHFLEMDGMTESPTGRIIHVLFKFCITIQIWSIFFDPKGDEHDQERQGQDS